MGMKKLYLYINTDHTEVDALHVNMKKNHQHEVSDWIDQSRRGSTLRIQSYPHNSVAVVKSGRQRKRTISFHVPLKCKHAHVSIIL